MMTEETIGKVKLDLSNYPGEDFYSEGASEDLLLELVKNNTPSTYNRLIAENAGWSTLYHLSDIRGNIADFLPINKKDKVLEVGSGCGAITSVIAEKAGSVTCIELSKKRSMINAYRNQDRDNIEIKVGNFQDIEKVIPADYDYIMLIGVFEYAASYIDGEKPYETFLSTLLGHLKEGGRLIIAIENKYGLKYWAGCREDHLGTFYSGIEGYHADSKVKTFSADRLRKLAKKAGCRVKEFYPFPDYKLPVTIFSEDRLPLKGELAGKAPNFDNDRFVAFDEGAAFDEIIEEGNFRFFSNSYLFMLEKGIRVESFSVRNPIFSKHSNERAPEYAIRTDIELDGNGRKFVVKYPATESANEHIRLMEDRYRLLLENYRDSVFAPNKCTLKGNAAEFEYVEGQTLHEILEDLLLSGQNDRLYELTDRFAEAVKALPGDEINADAGNIDLIFSNVIPKDDKWVVIDYEWTSREKAEKKFVIYRAVRYFVETGDEARRERARALALFERYGISSAECGRYEQEELALQRKIAGDRLSLIGFYSIFGRDAYPIDTLMERSAVLKRIDRVKVYYDLGGGFSEQDTCYYSGAVMGDVVSLSIPVVDGAKSVRIDPTDDPCMVSIKKITGNEALVNGCLLEGGKVFYNAPDPQIIVENTTGMKSIELEYVISSLSSEFAGAVGNAVVLSHRKNAAELFKRKSPYEKVRV